MTREDKLVERITYLTKIALGEGLNKDFTEFMLQAAIKAAKVGYSYAVDEAAEWLEKKAIIYVWKNCEQGEHGIHKTMLEDFRKALDISSEVYRAMLARMRETIDYELKKKEEREKDE